MTINKDEMKVIDPIKLLAWLNEEADFRSVIFFRLKKGIESGAWASDDAEEETIRQLEEKNARYVQVFENVKAEIDTFGELVGIDVEGTSLEEKARAFNEKVRQQAEEIERLKGELSDFKNASYEHRMMSEEARKAAERERDVYKRRLGEVEDESSSVIMNLRQQHTALRECLAFYADPATYDIEHLNRHGYIIIDKDGGERARAELDRKDTQPKEGDDGN